MNCRHLFALLFAVSFYTSALAQTRQDDRFNAYTGSYRSTLFFLSEGGNPMSFIEPSVGYKRGRFVRDNVARGWYVNARISATYAHFAGISPENAYIVQPDLEAGFFTRRYLQVTEQLRFFGEGTLGARALPFFFVNSSDSPPYLHQFELAARANAGATYFLKNGWALEATAALGTLSLFNQRFRGDRNDFFVALNGGTNLPAFSLGLTKYFGAKAYRFGLLPEQKTTAYQEGQRYVGGGFALSIPTTIRARSGRFFVSTARFKTPNQARGISFSGNFASASGEFERSREVGLFVRFFREWYWPIGNGNWTVFLNAGINNGYGGAFTTVKTPTSQTTNDTFRNSLEFSATAFPGMQYQLSPKWALVANLGNVSVGEVSVLFNRQQPTGSPINAYTVSTNFRPDFSLNAFGLSLRYFPQRRQQPG